MSTTALERSVGSKLIEDDIFLAPKYTAKASREVIVAAGAFNTPALLQLSGIGDPAHLSSLGIQTRVARPDVGKNLQDHPLFITYYSVNTTNTFDPITRGDPIVQTYSALWNKNHTGMFRLSPV